MRWILPTLICLFGCGARPGPTEDAVAELDAMRARLGKTANRTYAPSVHQYVVLTTDPEAMQSEAAVKAMWATVHGKQPRHAWIKRYAATLPGDYKANITLDFADLPHPVLAKPVLDRLLTGLPPAAAAQARRARLAVFIRGDLPALPDATQVRLVGLAVQHVAEAHDGVIIDLLTRRAWTRDAWLAQIKAERLGSAQVRLQARKQDGAVWLYSRGNPKFGEPDLLMTAIAPADLPAAKARFARAHAAILQRGGGRLGDASDAVVGDVTLGPCAAPEGLFDVECARILP